MYEKEVGEAVKAGVDICHFFIKGIFACIELGEKYYKEEKKKIEGIVYDERVGREIQVLE